MSQAFEIPEAEAEGRVSIGGGQIPVNAAAGILVAAALLTLIGFRVSFPSGR